jgi:hypothetical protein
MQERLPQAQSEIHNRHLTLSQDQSGTAEEREALVDAMNGLQSLRKDPDGLSASCVDLL